MPPKPASKTPKKTSAKRKATPAKAPMKTGSRSTQARAHSRTSDPEKDKLKRILKPSASRAKAALKRLGVTAVQVAQSANISDILKQGEGGLRRALEAMRFSTDINIVAFLEKYDEVPERDRKSLSWEAIAIAASVQPSYLLGGVILALREHSANTVKIMALAAHPKVTQKTIDFAMVAGGSKDRALFHQALGFTPAPKGSTFIINQGRPAGGVGGPEPDTDDEPEPIEAGEDREGDLNHLFPSITETQDSLVPPSARMLESGK